MYKGTIENFNILSPVYKDFRKFRRSSIIPSYTPISSPKPNEDTWNKQFQSAKNQALSYLGRRLAGDKRGAIAINSARTLTRILSEEAQEAFKGGRKLKKRSRGRSFKRKNSFT